MKVHFSIRTIFLILAVASSIISIELNFLHPKFVSVQLITFVSIISASVLAALNGLVFSSKAVILTKKESALQDKANSFWVAFLYIAITAAFVTLIGAASEWKTIEILDFDLDIFGHLSALLFSVLFVLIFFDFAPMIQHALNARSVAEVNSDKREKVSFEMPDTPDTKY